MDIELLSILVFFGLLGTWVFLDRKKIEFGLILIRRTQRGKNKIKNFAKKHSKFFNTFANVGVVIAILLSIVGFFYMFRGAGVRLILPKVFPGEASEGVQKVVFFMPLWYWVIGLFVIIVPHELFHGFLFALENIRIKSVGFLLFLIFPGGFVEPDEDQFRNSKPKTRMRVAVVGSIANVCTFLILIILGNLIFRCFYTSAGLVIFPINDTEYPAKQANLTGIIKEMNGVRIRSVGDFENVLGQTKPGDEIKIKTEERVYNVTLIEHPEKPGKSFLGVSIIRENILTKILGNNPNVFYEVKEGYPKFQKTLINWFAGLVDWLGLITVSVAIVNLLPFLPFDGGILWQAIFEAITKNKELAKRMIIVMSVITYSLLVVSFVDIGSILRGLGIL